MLLHKMFNTSSWLIYHIAAHALRGNKIDYVTVYQRIWGCSCGIGGRIPVVGLESASNVRATPPRRHRSAMPRPQSAAWSLLLLTPAARASARAQAFAQSHRWRAVFGGLEAIFGITSTSRWKVVAPSLLYATAHSCRPIPYTMLWSVLCDTGMHTSAAVAGVRHRSGSGP